MYIYILMRDIERRKEGRSKQGHSNNTAKQHNTPKAVTFPKKTELPRVGFEPTTLRTLDRTLYQLSYRGSCTYTVHSTMYVYMYIACVSHFSLLSSLSLFTPPLSSSLMYTDLQAISRSTTSGYIQYDQAGGLPVTV